MIERVRAEHRCYNIHALRAQQQCTLYVISLEWRCCVLFKWRVPCGEVEGCCARAADKGVEVASKCMKTSDERFAGVTMRWRNAALRRRNHQRMSDGGANERRGIIPFVFTFHAVCMICSSAFWDGRKSCMTRDAIVMNLHMTWICLNVVLFQSILQHLLFKITINNSFDRVH